MKVQELYSRVTQQIIKDLEAGVPGWLKPWKASAPNRILPYNAVTGREYNGINVPLLWFERDEKGYPTAGWLTYKQAQAAGAQVRGGEKATTIVFTKKLLVKEEDVEKQINMLRTFSVFNEAQIDGLPKPEEPPILTEIQRDDNALKFIGATQADIRHGGDRAFYSPRHDYIQLPQVGDFESYEHYLCTSLHELVHWSGSEKRLNRNLKPRFETKAYAAEELVAELGAAFLCAHLGVQGKLRHSEYIQNWLQLLKDDDRAVFTAASKASQAADYLRAFSETMEDEKEAA